MLRCARITEMDIDKEREREREREKENASKMHRPSLSNVKKAPVTAMSPARKL